MARSGSPDWFHWYQPVPIPLKQGYRYSVPHLKVGTDTTPERSEGSGRFGPFDGRGADLGQRVSQWGRALLESESQRGAQ